MMRTHSTTGLNKGADAMVTEDDKFNCCAPRSSDQIRLSQLQPTPVSSCSKQTGIVRGPTTARSYQASNPATISWHLHRATAMAPTTYKDYDEIGGPTMKGCIQVDVDNGALHTHDGKAQALHIPQLCSGRLHDTCRRMYISLAYM